jgi:hypothetical protein
MALPSFLFFSYGTTSNILLLPHFMTGPFPTAPSPSRFLFRVLFGACFTVELSTESATSGYWGLLGSGWEVFPYFYRDCAVFTQLILQGILSLIAVHEAHYIAEMAWDKSLSQSLLLACRLTGLD